MIVYYSGHGCPELKSKQAFLLPYDTDPNYANRGIALDKLYADLGGLGARSVTVVLDACFSGQNRESGMLLADARPVMIEVESPVLQYPLSIFAATQSNQISSGYPEQRHGLFSYFFLKGVQGAADSNRDNSVTASELSNYLMESVPKQAGRMDRVQTPNLVISDKAQVIAEY